MARPRRRYDPAAAGSEAAEIADLHRTAARLTVRAAGLAPEITPEALDAMTDAEVRRLAAQQPDHPLAARITEALDIAEGRK